MAGSDLDVNTTFKIRTFGGRGPAKYILNRKSTVHIGQYSFRNPPHFMAFWLPIREPNYKYAAEYEVEALIDHIFYHQNTGAFTAYRLIQRLVTSNPSPRYIKAASEAFETGTYGDKVYSGRYGDLGAMVAAVLLDKEARSGLLDLDPYYGRSREPLLKVIHLMRSLEYKSKDGREVELNGLSSKIGQDYASSPSVFNFYLPDFQPGGALWMQDWSPPKPNSLHHPLPLAS